MFRDDCYHGLTTRDSDSVRNLRRQCECCLAHPLTNQLDWNPAWNDAMIITTLHCFLLYWHRWTTPTCSLMVFYSCVSMYIKPCGWVYIKGLWDLCGTVWLALTKAEWLLDYKMNGLLVCAFRSWWGNSNHLPPTFYSFLTETEENLFLLVDSDFWTIPCQISSTLEAIWRLLLVHEKLRGQTVTCTVR